MNYYKISGLTKYNIMLRKSIEIHYLLLFLLIIHNEKIDGV